MSVQETIEILFRAKDEATGVFPEIESTVKETMESISRDVDTLTGETREIRFSPLLDEGQVADTVSRLNAELPDSVNIPVDPEIDLPGLESQSRKMEELFTWDAHLNLDEVEDAASVVEGMMDALGSTFSETGESITGMLKSLTSVDMFENPEVYHEIRNQIEKENEMREAALELQTRLTEEQIRYMEARREKLVSGGPIELSVHAEGLKPHLEMVWYEVIEALQVLVSGEAGEMLIGLIGE